MFVFPVPSNFVLVLSGVAKCTTFNTESQIPDYFCVLEITFENKSVSCRFSKVTALDMFSA